MRPFRLSDMNSLNKWLNKRGLNSEKFSELPEIGFIIPGVAIGFLRRCEGGYAIVDSLVSNPYASSETRHRAMDDLYDKLTHIPGYNKLLGFTTDAGALERAIRHGFKQIRDHAILALIKE